MRPSSAILVLMLALTFVQTAFGRVIRRDQSSCDFGVICWDDSSAKQFTFDTANATSTTDIVSSFSTPLPLPLAETAFLTAGGALVRKSANEILTFNAFDLQQLFDTASPAPNVLPKKILVVVETGYFKRDANFDEIVDGPKTARITWYFQFFTSKTLEAQDSPIDFVSAFNKYNPQAFFDQNIEQFNSGLYGPAVQLTFGVGSDLNTPIQAEEIQLAGLIPGLTPGAKYPFSSTTTRNIAGNTQTLWSGNDGACFSFNYAGGCLALAPVPEPSTYAMMAFGLIAMLLGTGRAKIKTKCSVQL